VAARNISRFSSRWARGVLARGLIGVRNGLREPRARVVGLFLVPLALVSAFGNHPRCSGAGIPPRSVCERAEDKSKNGILTRRIPFGLSIG